MEKHTKDVLNKCENCKKSFKNVSLHILQYKDKNPDCYNYYLGKYRSEDNFPWKQNSDSILGDKSLICEKCRCRYKQLYRHLSQYSNECKQFYLHKYGHERHFPKGATAKNYCDDCGKRLKDPRGKYCCDCRLTNYNVMKIPEVAAKTSRTISYLHKNTNIYEEATKEFVRKTRTPERRKKQSEYMKNGGALTALKGVRMVSKPQYQLYKLIKLFVSSAKLSYFPKEFNHELDIAIVEKKINIEYDGSYWHQDKERDRKRDLLLQKHGWTVVRVVDELPETLISVYLLLRNAGAFR